MKIKIYGERNTGTKFVRSLLEFNGHVDFWPGTYEELTGSPPSLPAKLERLSEQERLLLREAYIDDLFAQSAHLSL